MPSRSSGTLPWSCVLLCLALAGCGLATSRNAVPPPPLIQTPPSQTGIASWYGPGFHGLPTASGSVYDQYELTAAHPTLPLGTRVLVANLANGRSTEIVVNDRGPFVKGRIIDLSYAAAQILGMIGPGTIPVRIEVIDGGAQKIDAIRTNLDYTIQVGSFMERENAEALRKEVQDRFRDMVPVVIEPLTSANGTYYRVRLGTFPDRERAESHARRLGFLGFPVIIMEK